MARATTSTINRGEVTVAAYRLRDRLDVIEIARLCRTDTRTVDRILQGLKKRGIAP